MKNFIRPAVIPVSMLAISLAIPQASANPFDLKIFAKPTNDFVIKVQTSKQKRRRLRNQGYYNIRRVNSKRVEACFNGREYHLRLTPSGDVRKSREVGRCVETKKTRNRDREVVKPREVRAMLKARGFNRIKFTDRKLPRYIAEVCRNNKRLIIDLNRYGKIIKRRRDGRCNVAGQRGGGAKPTPVMSFGDIRDNLKTQGYRRIRFTDRTLPGYKATACRRGRKFNLRINRWGDVKRRNRAGWCETRGRIVAAPETQVAPRIEFEESELAGTGRLSGSVCQNFLEFMLDRNKVYFDTASARIKRDSFSLLNRLSRVLKRCPTASVEIAGHTDSRGSSGYNQNLSERRAVSVARYLFDRNIRKSRLKPVGYGEDRPVASNNTQFGLARNRRIEFVVDWNEEEDEANSRDFRN